MNKVKIAKQNGTTQFIIKSEKGQQLNERDVYVINNSRIEGLLPFKVERKNFSFKLIYDVTGYVTLRGFLKTPLSRPSFAKILDSLLTNIESMQKSYFNQQYLLLESNRVLVNPSTNKVYFIYVPIQPFTKSSTMKELLLSIAKNAILPANEDNRYIQEYVRIINNGINISFFELEEFVKNLSGAPFLEFQQKKICPSCNNVVQKDSEYCIECGKRFERPFKPLDPFFYDPASDSETERVLLDNIETNRSLPKSPMGNAVIVRSKTGEKKIINKPNLIIGKGNTADYCVTGNSSISRVHAEIMTYNGHYFLIDKESLNKTFFEGQEISPNTNIEIHSGARFTLADEEFIFLEEK